MRCTLGDRTPPYAAGTACERARADPYSRSRSLVPMLLGLYDTGFSRLQPRFFPLVREAFGAECHCMSHAGPCSKHGPWFSTTALEKAVILSENPFPLLTGGPGCEQLPASRTCLLLCLFQGKSKSNLFFVCLFILVLQPLLFSGTFLSPQKY